MYFCAPDMEKHMNRMGILAVFDNIFTILKKNIGVDVALEKKQ